MKIDISYIKEVEEKVEIPQEQIINFYAFIKDEDNRSDLEWKKAENFEEWLWKKYRTEVQVINYKNLKKMIDNN